MGALGGARRVFRSAWQCDSNRRPARGHWTSFRGPRLLTDARTPPQAVVTDSVNRPGRLRKRRSGS